MALTHDANVMTPAVHRLCAIILDDQGHIHDRDMLTDEDGPTIHTLKVFFHVHDASHVVNMRLLGGCSGISPIL